MNDNEYAICIYCKALELDKDSCGDVSVQGVFEAINTLTEEEQLALEYYYRRGMTLAKTGEMLGGMSGSRARHILAVAFRKLRHPVRVKKIRVSMRQENKNTKK